MRLHATPALALATAALTIGGCADMNNRYGSNRIYNPTARQVSDNTVIYRDRQGRYYCRKEDGTTGTLVGAAAGGLLGNLIAPGGSKTVGTIIGAAGGAVAGRAIDRSDLACD